MTDVHAQVARFETNRRHLHAVATRLLGSSTEADDAVQEAWLRFDRAGEDGIANVGGWLTTVVSRICLDHLRTRASRAEDALVVETFEVDDGEPSPEDDTIMREATAEALSTVLNTMSPVERVVFVLHDVFDVPFEEIAAIVDRSPTATRQLASRARRRVRTAEHTPAGDSDPQREIVAAFFAASRDGRLGDLIQLLAPGVVLRSDLAAVRMGSDAEVRGQRAVAEVFSGRARAARLARIARIDGLSGMVWAPGGNPRVVFRFTIDGNVIDALELIADPETIATMDVVPDRPTVQHTVSGQGEPNARS